MKRNAIFAAGLAALCLTTVASALPGSLSYRIPFADPFQYKLDGRPNPLGLSTSAVLQATNAAWNAWADKTNVPCSFIRFSYQGTTTIPTDSNDSTSVSTIWVVDPKDPYYNYALSGGSSVSAAVPLTYAGAVYACDIFLNGYDYAWSVGGFTPPGAFDLQTVLTHEVGHCLGFASVAAFPEDVMDEAQNPGVQKRVLQKYDKDLACAAYPVQGYGAPCSITDASTCSNGLKCITPPAGGGSTSPFCSVACSVPISGSGTNPCGLPYVCKPPVLIPGSGVTGTCLPSAGSDVSVAKACTQSNQCGSVNGQCIPGGQSFPSGAPVWDQGYCSQDCSAGKPLCPTGSVCYDIGGANLRCLKQCQPGSNQCRVNYACSPLTGLPAGTGACISSCHSDDDCGNNQYCRTCDGVCLSKGVSTTTVGDACNTSDQCGIGQSCLKVSWSTVGVCSQECSSACTACPSGSSCRQLDATSATYCLRDCQDGTCAGGQQCGYAASGRGCLPACSSDVNCPTSYRCSFGQCVSASPQDAGTCALCFAGSDGGVPSAATDGGTLPDVKPGSCGCSSAGASGGLLLSFLLLLALAGARRRWPTS